MEYKSSYLKKPKGLLKYKDTRMIVSNDGFFSQLDLSSPTLPTHDFREKRLNFDDKYASTVGLAWISFNKITSLAVNEAVSMLVSAAVVI